MPEPGWQLEVIDETGVARTVALGDAPVVVGRSPEVAVHLDRASVSRWHARLERHGDGWRLTDLGSRGGTFVNHAKLTGATPLTPADRVTISRFTLRLLPPAGAAPPPPASSTATPPPFLPQRRWTPDAPSSISVLTRVEPPRLDASHIAALSAFGRALMEVADAPARLRRLCELVAGGVIHARWAMALRLNAADPSHPPLQLAAAPAALANQDLHLSRSAIAAMQQHAAPILATNFGNQAASVELSVVTPAPATAAVVCPLTDDPAGHDLLYVNLPPIYGSNEWLALIALAVKQYQQAEAAHAARAAAAAAAAVARDLHHARTIQRSILPRPLQHPGLRVAYAFEPCELIGGDFVDIAPLPDGRVLLAIADATGHGLPAALATLTVHAILRTTLAAGAPLTAAVQTLNHHLHHFLPDGRFVTLAAVALDPDTGHLECVNAGHPGPLLLAPDGSHHALPEGDNLPLGLAPDELTARHATLPPGHTLALVTDGLTELPTPTGQLLGITGLTTLLTQTLAQHPDLDTAARQLQHTLAALRGPAPQLDDQTHLLARRLYSPVR